MIIEEKKTEEIVAETYTPPLLTKHEVLHALTGASGVKGCDTNIQCT